MFGVLFLPFMAILNGFVMYKLWLWFMVEPFEAPPIGIAHMIGLSVCIGLIAQYFKKESDDKNEDKSFTEKAAKFKSQVARSLLYTLCALLIAWITKLFM